MVASRIEARSLRRVARDVGLSPTGLQKFVDGSAPYSSTRRKLERWYIREAAEDSEELGAEEAFAALRVLMQDLPPQRQTAACTRIVALLESIYGYGARPRPRWLDALRERVDDEP